ncbi:MAG: hypothetical protein CMM59_00980 [Rhodospirillaceae bacterium]|nr:hypothetical protein [Rhodospirillaceae bacterium]
MFSQQWGGKGDLVFIINLDPMYKLIGGKEGRLAESLRETCKAEFNENIGSARGRGSFERDCFMMKFHDLGDQAGLEEAMKIENKIGFRTFGASFEKMEVPKLLVAADAGDITTNGKLDMAKTKEVIAQGGVELEFSEPSARAPRWMKLIWEKATQRQKLAAMKPEKKKKDPQWEMASPDAESRRRKDAPQWVENKIEKNRRSASDFVTRGPDSRLKQGSFEGRNRRETFDRRGRGY